MKKSILIILAIISVSCGSKIIPVPVELRLPPDLVLPKLEVDSLECVSALTYGTLVTRDKLLKARIKTLNAIIKSTHGE